MHQFQPLQAVEVSEEQDEQHSQIAEWVIQELEVYLLEQPVVAADQVAAAVAVADVVDLTVTGPVTDDSAAVVVVAVVVDADVEQLLETAAFADTAEVDDQLHD
jgi:Asp-tRNA(Asn)/Glu-tRNA(Gln) amidotransferase B subunit